MNVVVMLFLGAGLGFGVLLVASAVRSRSIPISEIRRLVESAAIPYSDEVPARGRHRVAHTLTALGLNLTLSSPQSARTRKDLAVTGSTLEQHALLKGTAPAATLVGVYVLWTAAVLAGFNYNLAVVTALAIGASAFAFAVPDIRLRARAKERRRGFRHALSAYLDLVSVIMAGGGGLLTALQSAADAGDGWVFAEIRNALDRARLSNRTPWSQLATLADRFEIAELQDLVASAELAGMEGSRIIESIETKADVLRARMQAEVESAAESLTEQMLLPVGLVLIALFLFLGFAIFDQIGGTQTPFGIIQSYNVVVF